MDVKTAYDIGEKVHIVSYRTKSRAWIEGEVQRIVLSKNGKGELAIKYTVVYEAEDEWLYHDLWQDDLMRMDCSYAAMPKIIQIRTDRIVGVQNDNTHTSV